MRLVIRDQGRRDGRQRAGEGRRQISDFGLQIVEGEEEWEIEGRGYVGRA